MNYMWEGASTDSGGVSGYAWNVVGGEVGDYIGWE